MGENIELTVTEDIVRAMPRELRPEAARVRVVFEYRGRTPLDFWSIPSTGSVHVPMESVRFIDDLAILQAWFDRHGCAAEHIHIYLWALLRQGRPLPPPLIAFGLDRDRALADHFVDDVSGKILKSSILFILAHEMGHVILGHRGQGEIDWVRSQRQEINADAFALDHFARIGAPPAGMAIYFLASRWRDDVGVRAQIGTHPVSPERIRAIAQRMLETPEAFSFAEPDPVREREQVLSLATDLHGIADITSDERMLELLPLGLERDFPLSRLQSACAG